MLFSSWIKWLNIVIVPIDISIHIPYPVATLGRYFTTLVWHPCPDPPPAHSSLWTISACSDLVLRDKLPDEMKRLSPRAWIIQQGMHPHPGPVWVSGGFDDSQGTDREESCDEEVDDHSSNGWPVDDRGGNDGMEEEAKELFARSQEDEPLDQCLSDQCVNDQCVYDQCLTRDDAEVVELAWTALMQPPAGDPSLVENLSRIGCPRNEVDMVPDRRQRVWEDPDASDDEEGMPPLVEKDSSDEELIDDDEVGGDDRQVVEDDYDTDEELIFSDWYGQERGSCRGEREGVRVWNAVTWAIETGHLGTTVDQSIHKECRRSGQEPDDFLASGTDDSSWQQTYAWGGNDTDIIDDGWSQQEYTPHQWCCHDKGVEEEWFTRSSASSWKPVKPYGNDADPHVVSVESGEGWCLPTDEAAMPKLQRKGFPLETVVENDPCRVPEWTPMSAKKVRATAVLMGKGSTRAKAAAKGKSIVIDGDLKKAWDDTFASDQPVDEDMAIEQYQKWCDDGQPGKDLVEASFRPSKYFVGSMVGWTFKTDAAGTGYYRNGVQFLSLCEQIPSMKGMQPLTLELDELVQPVVKERAGDLLKATLLDDKVRKGRSKVEDKKRRKKRVIAEESLVDDFVDMATVDMGDDRHRKLGLWAFDTVNPNAWTGAEEVLDSSTADFVAFQETKVEADEKLNKEEVAKGKGWKMSINTCLYGEGGGRSAGVAVGCRKHIGMDEAFEDEELPEELRGRFTAKRVGAVCKGGMILASAYLHSTSLGVKHPTNLGMLDAVAAVLSTLKRSLGVGSRLQLYACPVGGDRLV